MSNLVSYAYDLKSYQVLETPALRPFAETFYDVLARAEGDTVPTDARFRRMVQLLLADRFQLLVHREMRELPVYALVVGKNGPKFSESTASTGESVAHASVNGRNYDMTMPKATMGDVLRQIENSLVDRPVLDKTGLTGTYNIRMIYTPDTRANRRTPDPGDVGIFTAVQEQLGLRLEPRKAIVEMLIVDRLEKPSGN